MQTERLVLRRLSDLDAWWILTLVNDAAWLQYIGDRGIRTIDDAVAYLQNGPVTSYERHGFGLYKVELRDSGLPIGICGLIKRDTLDDVDLGFALLPGFRSLGYAHEAAAATLAYGRDVLGLARVVAIVSPENFASIQLLEKLGFARERSIQLDPDKEAVLLFGRSLDRDSSG